MSTTPFCPVSCSLYSSSSPLTPALSTLVKPSTDARNPLRVPALAVLIDTDAGDAVFLAEIPHGIRHGTLHPVAQQTVVGGAVPELFQQGGFVQLQNLRKTVGGQLQFVGRHLPRAGPQGPAAAVGRQQHAVGTVDAAPVGGHHGVPQLLPQCPPGVPVPGGQLQPVEPGNKPCKADAAQKQRHQPGTGARNARSGRVRRGSGRDMAAPPFPAQFMRAGSAAMTNSPAACVQ